MIIPKVNEIPTKPKAPLYCSFTITEPVPKKTRIKVPRNSAKYFFIVF